jgi:predicted nucleic acid-binding protein
VKANKFVDTNIFLRYFTADVPDMAEKSRKLIESLETGRVEGETSDLVIAELVWVLESFYKLEREEIYRKISFVISLRGLKLSNRRLLMEALEDYVTKRVDFIDSYNAAYMRHHSIGEVYSFDEDFDELDVSRVEPP